MHKKTQLTLVCGLLVLGLLFSACQTTTQPTINATQSEKVSEVSPTEQTLDKEAPFKDDAYTGPELTTKPITLRVLRQDYHPAQNALFDQWSSEFTAAHPNIKIQIEVVPFPELSQKIQTSIAAGDAPDIFMAQDGAFVASYVFNEIALPMNEYLSQDFMKDIIPATLNLQSVDGKLYMMPWEQQVLGFYFNRDMFEAAGVQTPPETDDLTAAWTWDQAYDAWTKLTKKSTSGEATIYGLGPPTFGAGGPGSNYWFEGVFIRSFGDPNAPKDSTLYKTWAAISEDGTTASGYIDTPEAIEAMKFYQKLHSEGITPKVGIPNAFQDKIAATQLLTDIGVSRYESVDFNWGTAIIPKGRILFSHGSAAGFLVSASTKYPAEAMAFLTFIHNDANRLLWHEARGSLPARISLYEKMPRYKEYPRSMLHKMVLDYAYAPPQTPGYSEYKAIMDQTIKDIALGADPAEALHKAAQQIDQQLAKYKK